MSEKLFVISGSFRVSVKAKTEEEAFDKFDEMNFEDMDRVDVDDIIEL